LIDTGTPDMASPLLEKIALTPELTNLKLRDVVLTHGHYDHAGGAAEIIAKTGARVWANGEEASLLKDGMWRRETGPSPTLHGHLLTLMFANRYPNKLPPVGNVQPIEGNVPVAGGLKAYPMPGHALGQMAFLWTDKNAEKTIFAGDVVMNLFGPREPILYEDRATGLRSIAALANLAKSADRIALGHGDPLDVQSGVVRKLQRLAGIDFK